MTTSAPEPEPPEPDPILEALPVTQMRLLTRLEYSNTVAELLQADPSQLDLPEDTHIAGFGTVGALAVTVNGVAAESYERASQALAIATFSNEQLWPTLVGCEPQENLSDGCVESYVRDFGRRAFRRALTEEEVQQWVGIARAAATESEEPRAEVGLAAVTAGLLQSPNFLYRVEHAVPDIDLGRIRFDGESMASRLAYLITGKAPDVALLDSAAAGELNDPEGVRRAATELLSKPGAVEHMVEFFAELTQLDLVRKLERDEELFPGVDEELRESMIEETRRWLSNTVLSPGADFREFFVNRTTFVNAPLAEFYGLAPVDGDFREVTLGEETGRAGILGKAGFLMAHSSPDSSNPTRRGHYILKGFTCVDVPSPVGLVISLPQADEDDGPKTTRQLFEQHAIDDSCVNCHSVMDPFGFALEHFDPVGRYRETENGLEIDAQATFQGETFDGALELGDFLFRKDTVPSCFVQNFYRYATGIKDTTTEKELLAGVAAGLQENGHVWRDMLIDFVASDTFTSLSPSVGIPKDPMPADEAADAL